MTTLEVGEIRFDPETQSATFIDVDTEATLRGVHPETGCSGRECVIHKPSNHALRGQPLQWDGEQALFYRLCPDGSWVLDPDQYEFIRTDLPGKLVAHCCGYVYDSGGPVVKCELCEDLIMSEHRHDFVRCECGSTAVDGGADYTRVVGPGRVLNI